MIYISHYQEGSGTLHIHLEGALDRFHVVALRDVLREAGERHINTILVHSAGLLSTDESGTDLLLQMQRQGAQLLDLPVTVAWKLQALESHTENIA